MKANKQCIRGKGKVCKSKEESDEKRLNSKGRYARKKVNG